MRRIMLCVLLVAAAVGCQDQQKSDVLPPVIVHTPLSIDPMDDWEVATWWTNGVELLRLDESGSYALFGSQNRYHPPQERGAWSKETYAVIRLEPYELHRSERVRVSASRIDGRIALTIPELLPMFALDGAPVVAEDRLLGNWSAPRAQLTLTSDRRYGFTPLASNVAAPAEMLGHTGRWRIEDNRLLLRPDPPNMGPYQLRMEQSAEDTVLILDEHRFLRQPERITTDSTS